MYDLRKNDAIDGWMSLLELSFLYICAQRMDSVVELGSYKGRSTYALCSGCKGKVIAIDNFTMVERGPLQKNVGHMSNLVIMKSDSVVAVMPVYEFFTGNLIEKPEKPIDMVFIDADHSYEAVKKDIQAWLPLTKKLICGHDWDIESTKNAVIETIGKPDDVVGSIWYKWLS